jgi:hypothetical protein
MDSSERKTTSHTKHPHLVKHAAMQLSFSVPKNAQYERQRTCTKSPAQNAGMCRVSSHCIIVSVWFLCAFAPRHSSCCSGPSVHVKSTTRHTCNQTCAVLQTDHAMGSAQHLQMLPQHCTQHRECDLKLTHTSSHRHSRKHQNIRHS